MIGHKRYGSREGGVEVVVTELARRMAALGHEVTCYDRSVWICFISRNAPPGATLS